MIKLKRFTFNPLEVNTYLLYNNARECVIVDPACSNEEERTRLKAYIDQQELTPVMLINTHCHYDHISGNAFVYESWGLAPMIHKEGLSIMHSATEQALFLGFEPAESPNPIQFLQDNEIVKLGDEEIEIRYTPGHADGSICLVLHKEKYLLSGDVLFAESVGRTDLPTGSMEVLQKTIREKLLSLDDAFVVYPGHGPETTIGTEKIVNPYL